jgi:hypothetical protein
LVTLDIDRRPAFLPQAVFLHQVQSSHALNKKKIIKKRRACAKYLSECWELTKGFAKKKRANQRLTKEVK